MKALNQAVIEHMELDPISDDAQRSALGMARTFLKERKPVARSVHTGFEKRDDLAEGLVDIIKAAKFDDAVEALAAARAKINAPFTDPEMAAFRAERHKRGELLVPKKGSGKKDHRES